MRRDRNRDEGSDAHPEHELELLLAARAVAERGEHEHEVFEVQVLKHLHDSRRERGYRELGDRQELVLGDVSLVPLVERAEALIQALDLAMVEPPAAVLLNLLDVVLREVQRRRGEAHRRASDECATRARRDDYVLIARRRAALGYV